MKHPNAVVIVTGDFNPTSTGSDPKSICFPNHLKQLVTLYTRDTDILDWFFTNRPHLFHLQRLPKVAASDHYTILARSTVTSPPKQDSILRIKIRQCRASNWRDFGCWMTGKDWSEIFSALSCAQKFEILSQELNSAMDNYFPWKSVKKHVSDKPWITNNIKLLSSINFETSVCVY